MVKLGPKLPPPSRRELDKLEKEQRRVAQVENGINPSVSGEPKEHLSFLLPQSKRTRSRRLGYPALEQARRKWEKNRQRTQARRLAKKNGTTFLEQGDASRSDILENITENGTVTSDREQTMRNAFINTSLISLQLGENLDDLLTGNAHERLAEDHLQNESSRLEFNTPNAAPPPLSPFLSPGLDLFSERPPVTAPHLDIEIVTDPFWGDKSLIGSSSSGLKDDCEAVQIESTPNSSVQIMSMASNQIVNSDKTHTTLPSLIADSVVRKSRSVRFGASSMNSSRVCTKEGSNKPFIFSDPLDLAKYRSKYWFETSYDSLEEYRELASKAGTSVQKSTVPYVPYNFLGSSLSSGSVLSGSSNTITRIQGPVNVSCANSSGMNGLGLPDCTSALVPFQVDDTCEWGSNSATTHSATGYSGDFALDKSQNSANAFPTGSKSSSDPIDADDLFGMVVRPRIPNTRPGRIIYPLPALEDGTLVGPSRATSAEISRSMQNIDPVTPQQRFSSYILHPSPPGFAGDDGVFSSNKPIHEEGDTTKFESPSGTSDSSDSRVPSSPSILRTLGKSVSNVVHTLAPAASITRVKKLKKPRIDDVDEMEKGSSKRFSSAKPDDYLDDGIPATPVGNTEGSGQLGNSLTYPDTPLVSRQGITAPASTPVTRSPLKFGMTLPSPPWLRAPILPTYTDNTTSDLTGVSRGFVSALKWMLRKTFGYFWQRRQ